MTLVLAYKTVAVVAIEEKERKGLLLDLYNIF